MVANFLEAAGCRACASRDFEFPTFIIERSAIVSSLSAAPAVRARGQRAGPFTCSQLLTVFLLVHINSHPLIRERTREIATARIFQGLLQ
jgi:hypothetical protein